MDSKKFLDYDGLNYYNALIKQSYVTGLGTSGNYLTWTKNGTTNNITVPYATKAQKDADGNVISSTYDKKPLVIEVDDTDTTVPSGTYENIGYALEEGKEVVVKVSWTESDEEIIYLHLVEDYAENNDSYYFGGVYANCSWEFVVESDDGCRFYNSLLAWDEHSHGYITSDGKLQTNDISIANGDKLVITDSSDNSKVKRASLSFDGSTTTQALTKKGTWESFLPSTTTYAGSDSVAGPANKAVSIPFGQVASTSTSTAFTATIDGITELRDGVCVYLKNGVVTSAANCTLNINGLGAKPIYQTMSATSAVTTHWNINYTELFIYNSSRVSGGCWDMFYGYYSDSNSIGYDIRENYNGNKKPKATLYSNRLVFSRKDGLMLPVNTDNGGAVTTHVLTTESFNPFGQVYFYSSSTTVNPGSNIPSAYLFSQAANTLVDLRYSFNFGSTLVAGNDVYLKGIPQVDGSAILAENPIAFNLPSSEDGYIYKRLGKCYDTYRIVLEQHKPIYYYKDGAIRQWTNPEQNITEGVYVEDEWNKKSTTRTGDTEIKKVDGKTLVWHELLGSGSSIQTNNCTKTTNNDGSITCVRTNSSSYFWYKDNVDTYFVANASHRYYISVEVKSDVRGDFIIGGVNSSLSAQNGFSQNVIIDTNYTKISLISTQNASNSYGYVRFGCVASSPIQQFTFKNLVAFDLTKMFGTGNEPTSVEEFEKLFPLDSYSYDAGRIINVAPTAIKSTDAGGNDLDQVSLPITTLAGKPTGSSTSEIIFPNGMNGIGDVKDEIDFVNGRAVKRIGVLDLGTLTWAYNDGHFTAYQGAKDAKSINDTAAVYNLLSKHYSSDSWTHVYNNTTNKTIGIYSGNNTFGVVDTSYSTAADFKTAVTGELLYYELATPIEYTLDTITLDKYKAETGGTETILPYGGTTPSIAPVKMGIEYKADLNNYALKPLVIEVNDTDTTVPSGTYASITAALDEGREVVVEMTVTEMDEQIIYFRLSDNYEAAGDNWYTFIYSSTRTDSVFTINSNNTCRLYLEEYSLSDHTHGNIQSSGTLQTTDVSIANGDKLVITDSSDSNKIARTSLTFDGSTTTQALSKKGTWESYATGSHTHGNITNVGSYTGRGESIANGDALVIVDSSNSGKLAGTSITFDGSTTTQALSKKGTWETFVASESDPTVQGWAKSNILINGSSPSGFNSSYQLGFDNKFSMSSGAGINVLSYTESDPTVPSWAKESSAPAESSGGSGGYYQLRIGDRWVTIHDSNITSTSSNGPLLVTNDDISPYTSIIKLTDNNSTTAGTWLATTDKITSLVDGQIFSYVIPIAGASTTTLEITANNTSLGAKTVYRAGTTKLTTGYAVGSVILLYYRASDTSFVLVNDLDTDTDTTISTGAQESNWRPYAAEAIYRYKLVMLDQDNRLRPIVVTNQSSTTQVAKTPTSAGLRPENIWWYCSTTTVSAGSRVAAGTLRYAGNSDSSGYTFNENIPANRMAFLRGTYDKTKDLFYLYNDGTSPCKSYYTFVPCNTANITLSNYFVSGYYYILVGGGNNSANDIAYFANNPMYYFNGTNLVQPWCAP